MTDSPAIEITHLTKYYGKREVVSDLSLTVPRGMIYGFLGRNGTGKTTTIRTFLGLEEPTRGSTQVLGVDSRYLTPDIRGRIGYLPEGHHVYGWMTVKECGQFQAHHYPTWNEDVFQTVLTHFRLQPKMKAGHLSRGQRAGLCLALTLAPEPELMVLDDPALGLDPVARKSLLQSMLFVTRKANRTIFFSSHILSDVERVADRIAVMDGKVLRADCTVELFRQQIRHFVLRFSGAPPPKPEISGLLSCLRSEREMALTLVNVTPEIEEQLEKLEPESIEPASMTLEDAFISFVGERGESSFFTTSQEPKKMKTLIWKELRENGKWAILAMLVLGLAEMSALTLASGMASELGATLCTPGMITVTIWGCAVSGFFLALLQIVPEQRRDQWAALLHRPVLRETIFFSKAVAGLALYFCATGVPFLVCAWYAFMPGHFHAPVVPGMMIPGLMDILAGTMFYAAGLFVALKKGPWYGLRLSGVVAALVVRLVILQQTVAMSLFLIAIMFGFLILAARGAMQTNGPLSRMRLPGQIGTVVLALATFTVLVPLALPLGLILPAFLTGEIILGQVGPRYVIDSAGTPFIVTRTKDSETATDMAGNVTNVPSNQLYFAPIVQFNNDGTMIRDPDRFTSYYNNDYYIEPFNYNETEAMERWYYVKDEKRYVGYSLINNLRFGSIGLDGFKHIPGAAKPFETPTLPWDVNEIVQSGRTFYLVDCFTRKLSLLHTSPEGEQILGIVGFPWRGIGDFRTSGWVAIAVKDHIRLVDTRPSGLDFTVPYDHDLNKQDAVSIDQSGKYFFIQYTPSNWPVNTDSPPSYLEIWDSQGKLITTKILPHLKDPPSSHGADLTEQILLDFEVDPMGIASHLAVLAYLKIDVLLGDESEGTLRENALSDNLLQILIVSMVFAGITYYWARRMQFSQQRACAWTLLVLATNVPGFLTFRFLSDWPQRVPCPTCLKQRAVTEQNCPHCKTAWPMPKRDGTEIFEPAEEQATVLRS